MKTDTAIERFYSLACLLIFLSGLVLCIYQLTRFLSVPLPSKLGYIGDDTFYYLKTCLNRAHSGLWSFDGINPTSGFHLLYALVLVDFIKLFSLSGEKLMVGAVLLSFLFFMLSSVLVFLISGRLLGNKQGLLISGVWMALFYNVKGILTGMEFGLVLFVSGLFLYVLLCFVEKEARNDKKGFSLYVRFAWMFLVSYLLCLARTDMVLMTGAFAGALLLRTLLPMSDQNENRGRLRIAGATILSGTAAGMLTISLFCYHVTGKLIQDNGIIKLIWANDAAAQNMKSRYDLTAAAVNFFRISGNFIRYTIFVRFNPLMVILCTAMLVIVLVALFRRGRRLRTISRFDALTTLAIGAFCHILVFIGFYSFSYSPEGFRPHWYYATTMVSLFYLLIYVMYCLSNGESAGEANGRTFLLREKTIAVIMCVILVANSAIYLVPFKGEWEYQRQMYEAAMKLRSLPENAVIGSWNAGILGYFSGRIVVNLDGLINTNVEEYAKDFRLDKYIEENDIGYIADYDRMLHSGVQSRILPRSWSAEHLSKMYSVYIPPNSLASGKGYSIWKVTGSTSL